MWSHSSRPVQLSAVRGSRFGCDCANVPGLAKPDTSWWLTAVSRAYLVAELLGGQALPEALLHSNLLHAPDHVNLGAHGPVAINFAWLM